MQVGLRRRYLQKSLQLRLLTVTLRINSSLCRSTRCRETSRSSLHVLNLCNSMPPAMSSRARTPRTSKTRMFPPFSLRLREEIIINYETSNMFQTTDKSSYPYSEDSGLSFWWGGYSELSSDSGADDKNHLKQSSFQMEIGFRSTMVTVARGGWFQPQFFKQFTGVYNVDK